MHSSKISRRSFLAAGAASVAALSGGRAGVHAIRQRHRLQAARGLVSEGRLGHVRYAHVYVQQSGRSLRNVEFALRPALHVLGIGLPDRVSSAGGPVREGLFPDHFMFTAYYPDRLRLVVTTTGSGGPDVTVRGTSGSMFIFPGEVKVALGDEAPRRFYEGLAETGGPLSSDNADGAAQARLLTAMVYASLRDTRVVYA